MIDDKIDIIGDNIFFSGYEMAKINKKIPSTIRGEFEEKIKGLDVKTEELEEVENLISELNARASDIGDLAFDLERLYNKIRG